MIGKVLRGERPEGLIYYLFGPGRREEHRDPHLVQGRPSRSMTRDQAIRLLDGVGPGSTHCLAAYVALSLLTGVRTEEAPALTWADVDLQAATVAVYCSIRAKGQTKTRRSRRVLKLPSRATDALNEDRKRQAARAARRR